MGTRIASRAPAVPAGESGEVGGYGIYPCSWNAPSAPPGYNIAVKIACKQNKANIAQEEQQQFGSNEDNFPLEEVRGSLQKEIRHAQDRLEAAIQAYSHQHQNNNNHSNICQPQQDRKHRSGSKHDAQKAGGGSSSNSSSKSVKGKLSGWI